jgi:hypothetical protein
MVTVAYRKAVGVLAALHMAATACQRPVVAAASSQTSGIESLINGKKYDAGGASAEQGDQEVDMLGPMSGVERDDAGKIVRL